VNTATIETFGETKALVIERFDRRWTKNGRLLSLPQEDCCQALSVPPTLKYQNEGGPGMADVLGLLRGSDTPLEDQAIFFKAQLIYWLIGAPDAHAKSFSLFLGPGGRYRMTPLYDIVTARGALVARQIERKQMKMAMSVGDNRHYRFDQIYGRQFVQTAMRVELSKKRATDAIEEVAENAADALETAAGGLPTSFPFSLVETVRNAVLARLGGLTLDDAP
jgi:serine/threonine-protein kinase HipA